VFFPRPPIEVVKNRCPETDRAIISDTDTFRVEFIYVNELANPNISADYHSTSPMQPDTDRVTPGEEICHFVKNSFCEIFEHENILWPPTFGLRSPTYSLSVSIS